mgnify:CR=1 FL=1|jgi:hypothetical protein
MDSEAGNRFPYPFLDYETPGLPILILVVAVIAFFYLTIGYLCFLIDRKMGFLEKQVQTDLSTANP